MEKKALQMSLQRKTSYMGCLLCQNIFVINRVICHSEIIFFFFLHKENKLVVDVSSYR